MIWSENEMTKLDFEQGNVNIHPCKQTKSYFPQKNVVILISQERGRI